MTSPKTRAARTLRAIRADVRQPPYVAPGHFYSPGTTPGDVQRALSWVKEVPGVDMREEAQVALARQLLSTFATLPSKRYHADNNMFGIADAAVYHAMLCKAPPRRVVEIGSGFSTAVLLDAAEANGFDIDITCVEPYPDRLLGLLRASDNVTLIRKPAQDAPTELMTSLEAGDILFIDSSHVAKAGSDVLWLFLRVLPRLAPGVVVHVHDVFWPFEYPSTWLNEHRDWNEDYLLNAFLCHNNAWEIELFSSWLWEMHPEVIPAALREPAPGGLWMRRVLA
jgi:predicted O-methyltransferase YrrM